MRLAALSMGLIVALGVADAAAQTCTPGAIVDAYRQGEAAYASKDFAAATALPRPLAEHGLRPAQLPLRQSLPAAAGKPAPTRAHTPAPLATHRRTACAQ